MQGQRSTSEPFCEIFEFERGSSSSNLGLDQQLFQNNDTHIPMENPNLTYPLASGNSAAPSGNVAGLQSANLMSWMSVGPSSSSNTENMNNHNEIKLQSDWTSSLTINREGRQVTEGTQTQPTHMLSSGNLDIDLNVNRTEIFQPLSQVSDLNGFTQNVGVNTQVSSSGFHSQPPVADTVQPQRVSTSSVFSGGYESSSRTVHNYQDNGGNQQGLLLGGRCALHKRKGIELVAGQSSTGGSSSNMNQANLGLNIPHEDINTRFGIAARVPSSDIEILGSSAGNQESFMRNTRMRTNQPVPLDSSTSNIGPQGDVVTHANSWSPFQSAAPPVPSNQLLESSLLGVNANPSSQHNVSTFPALPSSSFPISRNGVSASRVGSSSNPGERSIIEEPNIRTLTRNIFAEHAAIYPTVNNRDREQDPTNAGLGHRATVGQGLPGIRARSVFAAYQPPGTSGISALQRRRLPENIRRSIPHLRSEPRGQNLNLPPQLGHFSAPLEFGRVPARIQLPSLLAVPPILPDRQNEGAAIPLPGRHLGRNRNPSEMIYMTEVFRRIDPSLLEDFEQDVLLFGQSMFFGAAGAEFHDRHRELRLDVDNMSYEELLALEERIGNVNTGLDEEKIKKCLKQRKYFLVSSGTSSQDEPCCICQEEYAEGEDLGQLDCGHDFHAACIKEWLLIKNSCPICKNNAVNA